MNDHSPDWEIIVLAVILFALFGGLFPTCTGLSVVFSSCAMSL